jgi:ELWxxDGT repeat protein
VQKAVDINPIPGASGSLPFELTDFNSVLYLSAQASDFNRELWRSDGTQAGTVLVKDIHPSSSIGPQDLTLSGGHLFFTADDGSHGRELWKSDGTELGTVLVNDWVAGQVGSQPRQLIDVDGTLHFLTTEGANPDVLVRSDGTSAGTQRITIDGTAFLIDELVAVNDLLFFTATNDQFGRELWVLDTSLATTLLGDLDGDRDVDSADMLDFLANWTGYLPPDTGQKTCDDGDLDWDADVDTADQLTLMEHWTGAQEPGTAGQRMISRSSDARHS